MFDVDKGRQPTTFLRLSNHRQGQCRFPGRLRPEHFDDPASWESANAERAINQDVTSRNDVDIDNFLVTQTHDRAFTVVFSDLLNRQIEILISRRCDFIFAGLLLGFRRHIKRL